MSNQSKKIGPELDRENAHFSVSEAMIAAIEEVKTNLIIKEYYKFTSDLFIVFFIDKILQMD